MSVCMCVGLQNEILDEVSRRFLFKLRLGASGGYPVGLSVCLSVCLLVCLRHEISWVGVWVVSKFSRLLIGPIQMCVGGLSQVFKASDWPNSNLKDY